MNNMKIETWCGHDIRFIEINGEWWAILKDICDALKLRTDGVAQRLDPSMLERVRVEVSDHRSNGVTSRARKTQDMLAVNELGIYEALFASRRLEARKFRRWSASVMQKLRSRVGLEGYEVMRMTDKDIQDDIDHILDTLFWDEEKKCVMQSVTVQGGDVEQVPFE
jgi:prophage antirepressor-like protein